MIARFLVHVAASAAGQRERRVEPGEITHAQAGEKVHPLLVGAVDEYSERVQSAIDQALHVLPDPPVRRHRHLFDVFAEAPPLPGGVEQPVPPADAVGEGVDRGAGHLVDRGPGVLHAHGGLENEQVVVARVVEVDGAGTSHLVSFQVGERAPRAALISLHRNDDPAHDDVLTEHEDRECRHRGNDQRREDHPLAAALLQLVQPRHQRPHLLFLTDQQGHDEIGVGAGESTQGDDGENRLAEAHGDLPENAELPGPVDLGALVELARQRVEEPLEQEDRIAVRQPGQDQGPEGVEQPHLPEQEKGRDLRHHRGKGHGQHQEQQHLVLRGGPVAAQGVRGRGVDDQGGQHRQNAVDDGVVDAAAVQGHVVDDGEEVAGEEFPAQLRLLLQKVEVVPGPLRRQHLEPAAVRRPQGPVEPEESAVALAEPVAKSELDAV